VELTVRGITPGFPWLVSTPSTALRPRIAALLGAAPATWDVVEAAFLGLGEDTFTWYPLSPGAMRPPLDQALLAIARGAAAVLLGATPAGWVLADAPPARIDINLQVTGTADDRIGYRWSFSDFLATQPDAHRHLVEVSVPAPFTASEVSIVNDVPLAADGVRSIAVEVRTGGPSGLVRHEFLPGESSAARIRFVRETTDAVNLAWGGRCTVMTANGPAVTQIDFRASDQLIEVNPAALRIVVLRFAATPSAFDFAASIEIAIGARTVVLNRAAPETWAVGRQAPASVNVTAVLASGERHALGARPLGPLGLTIDAAALGAGEVVQVVLRPAAGIAQRAAYVAVQPEGGPWRTLDPDGEIAVPVRLETRLKPARLRYRTRYVARRDDGTTAVMAESGWVDASGETVTVSP